MPDRHPPRLVVTNTDADLERQQADQQRERAEQEVDWCLRELAANVIRVVRGAGKPYDIVDHAQAFIRALVSYRDATGDLNVVDRLSAMLSTGSRDYTGRNLEGPNLREARAEEAVIRGALQMAASRLLMQNTQRSRGRDELLDGIRDMEEANAERRREWDRKARENAQKVQTAKLKRSVAKKPESRKNQDR